MRRCRKDFGMNAEKLLVCRNEAIYEKIRQLGVYNERIIRHRSSKGQEGYILLKRWQYCSTKLYTKHVRPFKTSKKINKYQFVLVGRNTKFCIIEPRTC